MNISRSIWISIEAALLLFLGTFGLGLLLNFNVFTMENFTLTVRYLLVIKAIIISILFSFWYFQDKNIIPTYKEGIIFGSIITGTSLVVDFILSFIYSMIFFNFNAFLTFYTEWTTWIVYPIIFVSATAVSVLVGLSREEDKIFEKKHDKPKKKKKLFDETKDSRLKKITALVLFAWGLALVSFPGSFRVVGAVFLLSSIYLFIRSSRHKQLALVMMSLTALSWGAFQLFFVFGGFYSSLTINNLQRYMVLLLISFVLSIMLLGWLAFSKKK